MNDRPPLETLMDAMAEHLSDSIASSVLAKVRAEMESHEKTATVCFTEDEAAEKLHCSAQTLAAKRKRGEIDSTTLPSGRPAYMMHHLYDYLMRHEIRGGKQAVTFADVVKFPKAERELAKRAAGQSR